MKTRKMKTADRITETTKYEVYFDLWGLRIAWIEAIQGALHEYAEPSKDDECESYHCEACMAVRFTATDKARAEKAKEIVRRLLNLATANDPGIPSRQYIRVCG